VVGVCAGNYVQKSFGSCDGASAADVSVSTPLDLATYTARVVWRIRVSAFHG